jgi:hypothetical protein
MSAASGRHVILSEAKDLVPTKPEIPFGLAQGRLRCAQNDMAYFGNALTWTGPVQNFREREKGVE